MANEWNITDLMRLFLSRSKLSDDYWAKRIRHAWLEEYGPQWEYKIVDLRTQCASWISPRPPDLRTVICVRLIAPPKTPQDPLQG